MEIEEEEKGTLDCPNCKQVHEDNWLISKPNKDYASFKCYACKGFFHVNFKNEIVKIVSLQMPLI